MKKNLCCFIILVININLIPPILAQQNETGTFIDNRDNKSYKWVKIGTQVWMAENLNYNSGEGSWCYDDNEVNSSIYGRIYQYSIAMNVCPTGWHLPSRDEWMILVDFLGGKEDGGGKAKSITGWASPNVGATNESGFSALPGGYRIDRLNKYLEMGEAGSWWVSPKTSDSFPMTFKLYSNYKSFSWSWEGQLSALCSSYIRCIRDT
jgi:uncharacterized protein (TIGR02145 family)